MKKTNKIDFKKVAEEMNKYLTELKNDPKTLREILNIRKLLKFGDYSILNYFYIMQQNKNTEQIKGFNAWKKVKRNVKKGAKSLKVYAPITPTKAQIENAKEKLTQKNILENSFLKNYYENVVKGKPTGYKNVSVFDISQTEGEKLELAEQMTGSNYLTYNGDDPKEISNLYNTCVNFLKKLNISVEEEPHYKLSGHLVKYIISEEHKIMVNSEINDVAKLTTLFHEIGHYKFNHIAKDTDVTMAEPEAELFSYLISSYFNIDSTKFTNFYLTSFLGYFDKDIFNKFKHVINIAMEFLNELTEYKETKIAKLKQVKVKKTNKKIKAGA